MTIRWICALVAAALLGAGSAVAQQDAQADRVFDAIGMPAIISVMQAEGQAYGDSIAADMFAAGATPRWSAQVAQIYDPARMTAQMRARFATELRGADSVAMLAFYDSALGRRIVAGEIAARQALLDPVAQAAADAAAQAAIAGSTPRDDMLTDFITANDLIDANVVGALNAQYAFLSGLATAGGAVPGIAPQTLLADVWAQEDQIRATTTTWLYGFLLMAYADLAPPDLAALTAFTRTPAGRDLNRALFVAFDALFVDMSRDMGAAAGRFMVSQDL